MLLVSISLFFQKTVDLKLLLLQRGFRRTDLAICQSYRARVVYVGGFHLRDEIDVCLDSLCKII